MFMNIHLRYLHDFLYLFRTYTSNIVEFRISSHIHIYMYVWMNIYRNDNFKLNVELRKYK